MKITERAITKGAGISTPPIYCRASAAVTPPDIERALQLKDITASGDEDCAPCAAADILREFPSLDE
jgi:hypothetical protein